MRWSPGPVAVLGLGYVGLPTALALCSAGQRVIGLDTDPHRLDAVRRGAVDLPDADRARLRALAAGPSFTLTGDPAAVAAAGSVVICVPTPVDDHLLPDPRALRAACASVVRHATAGQTIVLASTSYVGTTRELLLDPLADRGLGPASDVFVACAPERIDPGNADRPQAAVPRVVGGATPECGRRAAALLRPVAARVHVVGSPETAELTKLLENTFRAVNIALANEFATIAGHLGLDVTEVVDAAATKPYGFMPFRPGPGAGGHCIPCDPHYLLWQLRAARVPAPLVDTAMTALAARPPAVARRARDILAARGVPARGARVLVAGVAYKPGVADHRESSALRLIEDLLLAGADVAYTDPLIPELPVGGRLLHHRADPAERPWDLVVVHTVHPGQDLGWLEDCGPVLDATYRLQSPKGRYLV
ncbi:nucleotide sugar dehydrogenase [Streptomyces johnsoniae]|uniref:Nucleotide sugar dehydrogenase n=1 Tax=Streptomyces johnsoniae TaxID=3075532 RepID=A0ABU2S8W6_9ACTN|nr:nucleotide sugar dehydrogenase [Streptomyces sp. DSM 41886]MDT0444239.1 nucleotide sugar dehydrogenase [Streptomyces sp. DSM 41886]